jgi:hypothetical protein
MIKIGIPHVPFFFSYAFALSSKDNKSYSENPSFELQQLKLNMITV